MTNVLGSAVSIVTSNDSIDDNVDDNVVLNEVVVNAKGPIEKIKTSGLNVGVLDIGHNLNSSFDLKDIVNGMSGIKLRQEGGMGSDYDLSINGLSGNSVRYFIDGMPLNLKGDNVKLSNIPLPLIQRVEVYKGVVPPHLGMDALGGAINIITNKKVNRYIDASLTYGSFNTMVFDFSGQFILKNRVYIRPTIGYSYSKNNYMMKDVELWDEDQEKYVKVNRRRFHDDYRSFLGQIEIGLDYVPWADVLTLSAGYTRIDKQIQTGATQNKVYGRAEKHSDAYSIVLRYEKQLDQFNLRASASRTWDRSETVDTTYRKYNWDGDWINSNRNELNGNGKQWRFYRRPLTTAALGVEYRINSHNTLALNYNFNHISNARTDKIDPNFIPTTDALTKHITSVSFTQSTLNQRLLNTLFLKDYVNIASILQKDNPLITGADQIVPHTSKNYFGWGCGSRYDILEYLSAKASYEHSVRLPVCRELLGNGTTVNPNLKLKPESSENINLGVYGTTKIDSGFTLSYELNGFLRFVKDYIQAMVSEKEGTFQYQNFPAVHIRGIEGQMQLQWKKGLAISLNASYVDSRDRRRLKSDGKPSATFNNRVPNKPWLYANGEASYTITDPFHRGNRLVLGYDWQWIHWYYLTWEAYGSKDTKAVIPTQNVSTIFATYSFSNLRYNLTLECNNIFDAMAYDNYMLQKPGRAVFVKFRVSLN